MHQGTDKAKGLCPLDPQQRQSLCNPFDVPEGGEGGDTTGGHLGVAPLPIPKPSVGFQGLRPWRGRGAEPLALLSLMLLAGCQSPPASAYVNGWNSGKPQAQVGIGSNTVGEACSLQNTGSTSADIFCGTWQQPSARVRAGGAAGGQQLAHLATASPWRVGDRYALPLRAADLDHHPRQQARPS